MTSHIVSKLRLLTFVQVLKYLRARHEPLFGGHGGLQKAVPSASAMCDLVIDLSIG